MQNYNKVELGGKVCLMTFVDFLPTGISESRAAVEAVARLEKRDNTENQAAQSIMSKGLVNAMYSNGTIYIASKFKDNKEELDSILERVENCMISEERYYTDDKLVQGFNPNPDNDGTDIHGHILRTGFAVKANLYKEYGLVSFTTIGLHHQGLPELVIVGQFADNVDMAMSVMHGVIAYTQTHGFKACNYPQGTIFSQGRVQINELDKSEQGMDKFIEPITEYWQDVDFRVAQILICDYAMRVPNELGYSQETNYQPLLPALKELEYA